MGNDIELEMDDGAGHFFARLDSGLVVGVDVYQRCVEPDRPFVQSNECAHGPCVQLINGDREGLAAVFVEGIARTQEEAAQVIPAGDSRLDLYGPALAVVQHFDEGHEKIIHSLPKLLDIGMLVCRALVAVDRDPLVDSPALEVLFLSQ